MHSEVVAAVEKRENHPDFHQISRPGFLLCIPGNLTSNLYLLEVFRGLPQYPQQVPEKNLFQIKPISAHYILLRRYLASAHDISLPSGKIKLCRCLIKYCITKIHGRVDV
jgi:hypothetical protein